MDRLIALRGSPVVPVAAPSAQEESPVGVDTAETSPGTAPSFRASAGETGTGSPASAADEAGMQTGRNPAPDAEWSEAHAFGDRTGKAGISDTATLLRSYAHDSGPHSQVLCIPAPSSSVAKAPCGKDLPLSAVEGWQIHKLA